MSQLSEVIQLTITAATLGVARAGFGIPLILSYSATWTERTRSYTDIAGVGSDFATNTPEYLAAAAFFAQSPHPLTIMIGRGALPPTQQYTISAASVANSTAYSINVVAPGATVTNPISYTSDSTATTQEIHNGLLTALNGVSGKNFTASFGLLATNLAGIAVTADSSTDELNHTTHGWNTGDGPIQFTNSGGGLPAGISALTDYYVIKFDANNFKIATSLANALAGTVVDITTNGTGTNTATPSAGAKSPILPFLVNGNAASNWFSLEVLNYALLANQQTHADPGVATDLAAILVENDAWYALHTTFNSKLFVLAAAAWVESNTKLYVVSVTDTDAINVSIGSSPNDTLAALFNLSYNRTAGAYYPAPATMFAAAWMGRVLPDTPGSETWKFKNLAGVTATNLNATQRANLRARKANAYTTIAGVNVTWDGTVAGGSLGFIDTTRGLDWLEDDMTKGVFQALINNEKIPYTDPGVAIIRSEVKASLKRAASQGIIDGNTIVISIPAVASISSSNKALRKLPDVKFSCVLQGAIHTVIISGVVSS